jgi:hypothetical protein
MKQNSSTILNLRRPLAVLTASVLTLIPSGASLAAATSDTVSRSEYEALKKQMSALQSRLDSLEASKSASSGAGGGNNGANYTALKQEVDEIRSVTDLVKPGSDRFTIAGGASASFSEFNHDSSNFTATFSPIFLWKLSDNLFFEGELEMELEGSDTIVNLEYAHLTYALNDYITIGAGKFLSPMNAFVERYEPGWINKLPDTPLAIYDGILPESNVGVQIRGVVPIGDTRLTMVGYVSNSPTLIADDPEAAGQLDFNNFSSTSDEKAVGGHVGFSPIPGIEAGYGIQTGKVFSNDGSVDKERSTIQSVDFIAKHDVGFLKGALTLQGQYAWSSVGQAVYDASGDAGFGPANFTNKRNGGYVQLSYRPKELDPALNKFEFIVRGDRLDNPTGAPGAFDERRLTFGIDYWISAATVLKAAYEIDHRDNGEPSQNGFLVQFATGL